MNRSVKSALAKLRNATKKEIKKECAQAFAAEQDSAIKHQHRLCFVSRKHCPSGKMAGLLACNITAVLPIPRSDEQWTSVAAIFCVTYSCATARDLHTVPY